MLIKRNSKQEFVAYNHAGDVIHSELAGEKKMDAYAMEHPEAVTVALVDNNRELATLTLTRDS